MSTDSQVDGGVLLMTVSEEMGRMKSSMQLQF